MTCILCTTRKPRRNCPAAQGDICPQCCAEQREERLACPLDCEHLLEARKHEKLIPVPASAMPHPGFRLTDEFLNQNDALVRYAMMCVGAAAVGTAGASDADVREAIDALMRTLETAGSGLIYETKPANPFAATIQARIKAQFDKLSSEMIKRSGGGPGLRDKDVLGVLVFLSRVAISLNNGRRKGRPFISMLYGKLVTGLQSQSAPVPAEAPASNLIVTP